MVDTHPTGEEVVAECNVKLIDKTATEASPAK